jgi:hypothetical protein
MPALQAALDAESYEFMVEGYPELVEAVAAELRGGASPVAIGRFALRLTQRPALALRLEQAARHLASGQEG